MITCPATESIPGTSLEPNLRCIVTNIHKVAPAVRGISTLFVSNHHTFLADGTVSNCLSAIAEHVRNGSLLEKVDHSSTNPKLPGPLELLYLPSGNHELDSDLVLPEPLELLYLPSGNHELDSDLVLPEPLELLYLPSPTAWIKPELPLLSQLEGKVSMAPHVEIDESHVNAAGKQAHALVLCAPDVVVIRIESNKTKVVMNRVFHGTGQTVGSRHVPCGWRVQRCISNMCGTCLV